MADIFVTNLVEIKMEIMMKLEELQQDKEMITQEDLC